MNKGYPTASEEGFIRCVNAKSERICILLNGSERSECVAPCSAWKCCKRGGVTRDFGEAWRRIATHGVRIV